MIWILKCNLHLVEANSGGPQHKKYFTSIILRFIQSASQKLTLILFSEFKD